MKPDLVSKKIYIIKASKLSFFVRRTFLPYLGLDKIICSREVSAEGRLEMQCLHVSRIKGTIDTFPTGLLCQYLRKYCKFSTKPLLSLSNKRSRPVGRFFFTGRCDPTRRRTTARLET